MNKALLDTDTYSEILKAVHQAVARNATGYRQHHGVYILSAVTVMEIVYGFQLVRNSRRLRNFLTAVALVEEVIPFDQPAGPGKGDSREKGTFYFSLAPPIQSG